MDYIRKKNAVTKIQTHPEWMNDGHTDSANIFLYFMLHEKCRIIAFIPDPLEDDPSLLLLVSLRKELQIVSIEAICKRRYYSRLE